MGVIRRQAADEFSYSIKNMVPVSCGDLRCWADLVDLNGALNIEFFGVRVDQSVILHAVVPNIRRNPAPETSSKKIKMYQVSEIGSKYFARSVRVEARKGSVVDHGHFREDGVRRRILWSLIAIYKSVQQRCIPILKLNDASFTVTNSVGSSLVAPSH